MAKAKLLAFTDKQRDRLLKLGWPTESIDEIEGVLKLMRGENWSSVEIRWLAEAALRGFRQHHAAGFGEPEGVIPVFQNGVEVASRNKPHGGGAPAFLGSISRNNYLWAETVGICNEVLGRKSEAERSIRTYLDGVKARKLGARQLAGLTGEHLKVRGKGRPPGSPNRKPKPN